MPKKLYHILIISLSMSLLLCLSACTHEKPDEQQIRELIEQAENYAEQRDSGALVDLLSEDFSGRNNLHKKAVRGWLMRIFFRYKNLHLLTRIHEIKLLDQHQATARVTIAMASVDLQSTDDLNQAHARLLNFDLNLRKIDGDWFFSKAQWQEAQPQDMINGF